jgi:PAS domain S-box-containing protein
MVIDISEAQRALEKGEFFPYFQPLVELRTGQLTGFEVLARWKHAGTGMIMPEVFIPLAERDGWINALTHQILRKAFTSALSMPSFLQLSVNISPIQLRDSTLTSRIESIAGRTGFSLNRLMVEITESALTNNLEQARLIAKELKELGCKLALDDFGTGYSSLLHLQSLPFDELKVDRSFVTSMVRQRHSRKIVAAVVGLGQSLGLTTVAEGVETDEQAEMLMWLGCDIGQGWLFGRPEPAEDLPSVLSAPRKGISTNIAFPWKNTPFSSLQGLPAQKLAQLQAVFDGAPVGLGFLDRDLRYVNLNRQLAEMGGHSVEEYLGRTAQEMVPRLYPKFEPYLRRALQGEAISGIEIHAPAVGAIGARTNLVSYQPACDEAGEVVGVSIAVLDFTARKQAEESLQQYERVVEGLEEMIVVVDRDYRYVLANRAFLDNRSTTKDQLLGSLVSDYLSKETFETLVKGKLDECFRGNVVKYEMKSEFPGFGQRDLLVNYIPIEVSGGVTGAACVLRDMTEMKRMAQVNLDWQKRIELAEAAGLGIGLWDWDLDANTVVWSEETYRQFGFTRGTFSGRVEDATKTIHPEDRPRVEEAIQNVLTGRKHQYASQYRIVRPDGSICWIEAHGVIVRDRSAHMLGIGVDITEIKKAEESLHESEEKYLLLLNSTAQAIYGIDMNGDCTFCNPACLRLLGYTKSEDLHGKNMHKLVHHSYADGSPYPVEKCQIYVAIRKGEGIHVTDDVMWRDDGTSFPVEYWSHPIHKSGVLAGAVVTFLQTAERNWERPAISPAAEK